MASKNTYDVVLEKVGNQQLKTTKTLCSALGLGLAAAKGMVDQAPTTVAKGLDKDKALALRKELEALGNTVSIPGMETKTEAPATKKTTTTKKQTTKKSAPSPSKASTPSNDDFDAIFGGDTAQKETKPKTKTPQAKIERIEYASGNVYEGEMKDGLRNGVGTFRWSDGDVYIGEYVNDVRQGKGKFLYASGNVYEGDFFNGNFHGYGVFRWADGDVYDGEWKNDERHGSGKYTYADGSYYTGVWENGDIIDSTKIDHPAPSYASESVKPAAGAKIERVEYDNGSYEGEIVDGYRHGKGKYTWADGSEYEGDWVKGKKCGFGVYRSYSKNEKDGSTYLSYIYEGEWKDGKKHGQGIAKKYKIYHLFGTPFMTWSHEGGYANGDMHGHGIYKEWNVPNDTGRVHEGEWVNNKRQGRFVWEYEPSVTGKKYIDFYDQGHSVVFGIDYDPSINTPEEARRVKAENDAVRDRVIAERRAREAAQSRTSTASAAPSGSSHAALRQQIADAKARGTIFTVWESIDPSAFDEKTAVESDGILADTVNRIMRAEITGGYAYVKPINDTTAIYLYITNDYIRERYICNDKIMRKEYATKPDGTGFFKKEMYLDKDDKQIGYAFAFEAGSAQGVYTLEDCLSLPNKKWQYYFALDPDGN